VIKRKHAKKSRSPTAQRQAQRYSCRIGRMLPRLGAGRPGLKELDPYGLAHSSQPLRRGSTSSRSPSKITTVTGDRLGWEVQSRRLQFARPSSSHSLARGRGRVAGGVRGAVGDTSHQRQELEGMFIAAASASGGAAAAAAAAAVHLPPKFRKRAELLARVPSWPEVGGRGKVAEASTAEVEVLASVLRVIKCSDGTRPTTYDLSFVRTVQLAASAGAAGTSVAEIDCVCFGLAESFLRALPERSDGNGATKTKRRKRVGGRAMFAEPSELTSTREISGQASASEAWLMTCLCGRLRSHLRRSWCGVEAVVGAARRPFADPGLWTMLCSDPADTCSLTAAERREDAAHAVEHVAQLLDALEFGGSDEDSDSDRSAGTDAGSPEQQHQRRRRHSDDAGSVSLVGSPVDPGVGDSTVEGNGVRAPLQARKWMPGSADYPGLCGAGEDGQSAPATATVEGNNDDDSDESAQLRTFAAVELRNGGSVADHAAHAMSGAVRADVSASSSSASDDDGSEGSLEHGVLGQAASDPPRPKPPSRQLSAVEANTVALELRVMLSTCWRAAIPLPPAAGNRSTADTDYWKRASQLVSRAWRISPPSSRRILAEVSFLALPTSQLCAPNPAIAGAHDCCCYCLLLLLLPLLHRHRLLR